MARYAQILIVICFTASLFWCGDLDCATGGNTDQCASLFCGIFGRHSDTKENTGLLGAKDCSCVCHVPAVPVTSSMGEDILTPQQTISTLTFASVVSPLRLIYHPPKA